MDLCRTTNWSFWHRTRNLYTAVHTRPFRSGHAFPYGCSGALREEIARQMQLAVTASGADQCSVNADVFVDGEGLDH